MKKILIVLILLILLKAAVLFVFKDIGAKIIIEKTLEKFSDLDVSIKKAKLNISLQVVSIYITDLMVHNPSSFPEKEMITFPSVIMKVKTESILKGKPRFELLSIYMKNLNIIKSDSNDLNISKIGPLKKKLFSENLQDAKTEDKTNAKKSLLSVYPIEKLNIKIDKITFKDYSVFPVLVKEIEVNMEASYNDIKDLESVCDVLFYKIFSVNSYLLKLLDINLNLLKNAVSKIINTTADVLNSGTDALKQILPNTVFKELNKNIKNIPETVKQ